MNRSLNLNLKKNKEKTRNGNTQLFPNLFQQQTVLCYCVDTVLCRGELEFFVWVS